MKSCVFKGAGVALVTPFKKDMSVDFEKLEQLIEWQIQNSTDAIIVCGTTGESATLTFEEHKKIVEFSVKTINSRVPLIAGTGSNSTAHAKELSVSAKQCGADAILCVTPYYNKTTQDGLIRHYTEIASCTDLPMIVYNVPSRTGVNTVPKTYAKLAEIENVVGIKEANGNISALLETISLCGDRLAIYSGNDDQIVPTLSLGGMGVISVASNICPKLIHKMCALYFCGECEKSARLQIQLSSLINSLFCEVNPLPVKYAMNLMNMMVGPTRAPLYELTEESKAKIKQELKLLRLIG